MICLRRVDCAVRRDDSRVDGAVRRDVVSRGRSMVDGDDCRVFMIEVWALFAQGRALTARTRTATTYANRWRTLRDLALFLANFAVGPHDTVLVQLHRLLHVKCCALEMFN